MKGTIISLFVFLCFLPPLSAQQQVSEEITIEELRGHVTFLASEELQGRRAGTEGAHAAADYIREQFRLAGVRLLAEEGFQDFRIVTGVRAGDDCMMTVAGEPAEVREDFLPLAFSGQLPLDAPVRFAGFGFDFESPAGEWRDYDGLDVAGSWVLVLRGSPDDDSGEYEAYTSLLKKAMVARDHGAAGVLFVAGPAFESDDRPVPLQHQRQESSMNIPVLSITRRLAEYLLSDRNVEELEQELIASRQPVRTECDGHVKARVSLIEESVTGRNVLGIIEGNDPRLQDEYVILGAHYDHLGLGGPRSGSRRPDTVAVHYGADDNASGVASVIEIGERIALQGGMQRSVILAAFDAEEMGLLGSKHLTANPPVDLARTALMCNFDMVGRFRENTNTLSVGGTGTADGLIELLQEAGDEAGLELAMSPEGYGPSDHAAFYAEDIPVLFFFTGVHDDYHTPFDTADRLNYAGQKRVSDFVYDVVAAVTRRDEALRFTESGPKSRPATSQRFKVTLGIMPDVSSSSGTGLRVDAVVDGRPASLGGMQKGDVIISMDGKPVNGVYEYMNRLSDFEPGQRISIEVQRDEETVILIVDL
ncbi:MAG: M28 family peptidase [Bacteroidetes bacterium]|nr:M28 family peptidase [Bacteroidota bacterium]